MAQCLSSYICNSNITNDIQGDCENPMFAGIEEAGVIINYSDIESYTRDPNNPHIINNIVLAQGAQAYKFINQRNNPFTGTNTTVNVGDYRNDFTATVAGFIPLDGAEPAKEIITPMANGRFVVILQNQWHHTDSNNTVDNEFQIYGIDKGLRVSTLTQTRYENNDYWLVELQETNIPRSSTFYVNSSSVEGACNDILTLLEGKEGE